MLLIVLLPSLPAPPLIEYSFSTSYLMEVALPRVIFKAGGPGGPCLPAGPAGPGGPGGPCGPGICCPGKYCAYTRTLLDTIRIEQEVNITANRTINEVFISITHIVMSLILKIPLLVLSISH